jgi:hypothetical protein
MADDGRDQECYDANLIPCRHLITSTTEYIALTSG